MKEKKPKSPILVIATMLFLLMFIVLPPLFRSMFPVEEIIEVVEENQTLTCSKVSVGEKIKVISEVTYENGVALTNNITYMDYAASEDEGSMVKGDLVLTAAEELALFRTIEDIEMTDGQASVYVLIEKSVIDANSDNLELINFLLPTIDEQEEYYSSQGYSCAID